MSADPFIRIQIRSKPLVLFSSSPPPKPKPKPVLLSKRALAKTLLVDCSNLRKRQTTTMEDENTGPFRRTSSRTRKMATKMSAALANTDNRTQAALARLEALESDNAGPEVLEVNDDEYDSMDDDDQVYAQKKQAKGTKRKTRQAKALENAKKAPRSFMEVLNEANLESLPPHVPSYLRAAVGPPTAASRRHFCTVCGNIANYTCVRCGVRFCSCRCQVIHNDTRCLKFIA
ncbi:Zinc finger HIT domain-containing 1 [Rhynchospora pubera]|uniref:Zinc finger HIT domain-containing 1 n=1 Tax=Rhynchospora pubera TaxID=906938 RepID=A0AAV8GR90_9POAL|nr:Zinc finger HIT domain-containing 1 [Rhynchospora pubera]